MTGIKLPFRERGDDAWCGDEHQHILQSVRMILTTRPGTRPLMPGFGCRIQELLFRPATPAIEARAVFFIEQAIAAWEPRVDQVVVSVESSSKQSLAARLGLLHFFLEYRVIRTGRQLSDGIEFGDGQVKLLPGPMEVPG